MWMSLYTYNIKARRKKAQQAFAMLHPVWSCRALRTKTKLQIFNSNVKSVLLYSSETWRETNTLINQVQVFVNKCLWQILGIQWSEKLSNRDLWQRTGHEPIHANIKTRCLKWLRHTLRKEHSIVRSALAWNPQGKRKQGQPKNTWHRGLKSDLDKIGITWGEAKQRAKNRTRWRTAVDAICLPWDEWGISQASHGVLSLVSQGGHLWCRSWPPSQATTS